ncbi:unnamed protein product, partial [Iphiclides podalirius]
MYSLNSWTSGVESYIAPVEPAGAVLAEGHALPSIAATSPADWECRSAARAGLGGARRGSASTPAEVDPKGHPVTNSWRVASVGLIRRLGSHLRTKAVMNGQGGTVTLTE